MYSAEKTVILKVKQESVQRKKVLMAAVTKVYAAIVGVVIQAKASAKI